MKPIALFTMLLIGNISLAQEHTKSIGKVFTGLSDAWEQADGRAWGNFFSEDADFTVWFGLHLKGRKAIAEGHQWVFEKAYPNTRYEFTITSLKFLQDEVAVAHLHGSIIKPGESLPEDPHTLPVTVLQKFDDDWKIVTFHNMKNRLKEIEEGRKKGEMGDVRH